ncbi:hypothetical protein [Candidatus Chloroploca asiatica]|uniref:Uncharacterized protein n=1 Tax=Candidatus Chloroploca asiatica TaxID=1506545 RepID=A0A2H3L1T7_9CHLR|nr:hypothetical protein [Candidatus Chloroploca asiatica]PDV97117.1 hypothetical protein A9Q02_19215 [Candidatus Chloroploca asiatica]
MAPAWDPCVTGAEAGVGGHAGVAGLDVGVEHEVDAGADGARGQARTRMPPAGQRIRINPRPSTDTPDLIQTPAHDGDLPQGWLAVWVGTPDDHDATQEPRQHAGVPLPVYDTVANGPAILALKP